jgi:hypothetical protein
MKTSQWAAVSAAVISVGTFVPTRAYSQTIPSIPVGSLSAFPTVVQQGTKPTLTWSINYPSIVKDFVTVTGPNTIIPKENLVCDIRILGAGVTSQNSNGSIKYYYTRGRIAFGSSPSSSSYTTIWNGRHTDTAVQQQAIIKANLSCAKGVRLNFGGQYNADNSSTSSNWAPWYSTSSSTTNVRTLVSGDLCPTNMPDYDAPSLESFLRPYLDSSKRVRIGPMDVIVFMELTHTDQSNIGYDLQDLAFLVTFRKP